MRRLGGVELGHDPRILPLTEGHSFRMIFVPEDETDSLSNGTCLIRGSVYVVDWNWVS